MAKGYVIVRATVTNTEQWAKYAAMTKAPLETFGGVALIRGGKSETIEGIGAPRNVVLEFPSYEAALGYATSAEYAAARKLRDGAGVLDMVVVEGV